MSELNKRIGQNLARFRGAVSQAQLASEMRERGHKWSQATVWSIEKGERALRLEEAKDALEILNGDLVDSLLRSSGDNALRTGVRKLLDASQKFEEAAKAALEAHRDLEVQLFISATDRAHPASDWSLMAAKDALVEMDPASVLLEIIKKEELKAKAGVDEDFWSDMSRSGEKNLMAYLQQRDQEYQRRGFRSYQDWQEAITISDRELLTQRLNALNEDDDGEH